MEERKPMYEFDLGFMGKVICSADTADYIMCLVTIAKKDALRGDFGTLPEAYSNINDKIHETLETIGYYNKIL